MDNCAKVLEALRRGLFVLVYDAEGREEETDMIVAAEFITPKHVYSLRSLAGGLICVALSYNVARKIGLPFMTSILEAASSQYSLLSKLAPNDISYGDRPAFSITVNHRKTVTGITDKDRALTIKELAKIAEKTRNHLNADVLKDEFGTSFRSPGHVPILIAVKDVLHERRGHTELSVALAEMSGLTSAIVVCEMLNGETGCSLTKEQAIKFAKEFSFPFVSGEEIVESYFRFYEGKS
jgi:3,4-dihydroxy 2-butanone 4-phosphate synthase